MLISFYTVLFIGVLALIALVIGLLPAVAFYRSRVEEVRAEFSRRWLRSWVIKGIAVPLGIWIYMSTGAMPVLPGISQYIKGFKFLGIWLGPYAIQTGLEMVVVASFWAAVTFAWFAFAMLKAARNREDLIITGMFWSPLFLVVASGMFLVFHWTGMALAAALGFGALTHYTIENIIHGAMEPRYGSAIGKLKMGKYAEAEQAIIGELEKCDTHFEGWMMLAELYAIHFHDLPEAERTVRELCMQPETGLSEFSIAMHRLADWHMKLNHDADRAQQAMEEVCARMPGTHLALMAKHRIKQLKGGNPELDEHHRPRVVPMPKVMARWDQTDEQRQAHRNRESAQAAADACVEKLNANPQDHGQREKLARIFAEELQQVDLALEQLELLVEMPEQPEGKTPHWLALMAHWLIEFRNDREQGIKLLRRVIEEFPRSPEAFEAQRRVSLMEMERRAHPAGR